MHSNVGGGYPDDSLSGVSPVRNAWFDLLIIVLSPPFLVPDALQSARGLRAVRLLRLVRAFSVAAIGLPTGRRVLAQQRLVFVAAVAVTTVVLDAAAVFLAERARANRSDRSRMRSGGRSSPRQRWAMATCRRSRGRDAR